MAKEWVHLLIHALGPLPSAWYLDAELHQLTCHWETLKEEFLGTFGLVGRTVALDTVLRDIDTRVWDESHLFITPELPTWETPIPSMVKYRSLAPTEGKEDPRAALDLELEGVRMATGPLRLRMGSNGTHPIVAKNGDVDTEGRVIIYL